jgi:hypothetical protein
MTQEELRDDVPPEPERPEEGTSRPAEPEWDENEPSPHQGEEDQEAV